MNQEGGAASRLRASTLATLGLEIGADSSPVSTTMQVSDKASCGNTEFSTDTRSNTSFYFVSLGELKAYRVIDAIVDNRSFGLWDTHGILHPTPHSTQWNWSRKGLWLTCFYRETRHNGVARVYAVCKGLNTLRRFLRTTEREVI